MRNEVTNWIHSKNSRANCLDSLNTSPKKYLFYRTLNLRKLIDMIEELLCEKDDRIQKDFDLVEGNPDFVLFILEQLSRSPRFPALHITRVALK